MNNSEVIYKDIEQWNPLSILGEYFYQLRRCFYVYNSGTRDMSYALSELRYSSPIMFLIDERAAELLRKDKLEEIKNLENNLMDFVYRNEIKSFCNLEENILTLIKVSFL